MCGPRGTLEPQTTFLRPDPAIGAQWMKQSEAALREGRARAPHAHMHPGGCTPSAGACTAATLSGTAQQAGRLSPATRSFWAFVSLSANREDRGRMPQNPGSEAKALPRLSMASGRLAGEHIAPLSLRVASGRLLRQLTGTHKSHMTAPGGRRAANAKPPPRCPVGGRKLL